MSSKHIKEIIIRNILAVFYQKSATNLILRYSFPAWSVIQSDCKNEAHSHTALSVR